MDHNEKYVLENWKDQCRYTLARNLKTTEKQIQKVYHSLRDKGLLPSGGEMRRYKATIRTTQTDARHMRMEYIKNNWMYKNQVELGRALGIGRDTVGRMQRELAQRGEMPTGQEIQAIKSQAGYKAEREKRRRTEKHVLHRAWVPNKWINHQLKWLGA